jgi:peptidoglycan/LPS O-acetylase OafA/YrhL
LPAVLFCIALAWILSSQPGFDPSRYSNYSPVTLWHAVSSLLFLNQSWLNEADLVLNNPYWSLCYEVWFYVIFGAWYFAKAWHRVGLVAFASLVAGPSVLMLMPIWLMGAWLAKSQQYKSHMPQTTAWLAFLGPLALIVFIKFSKLDSSIQHNLYQLIPGYWRLDNSQRFVTDFLIGAALCLHIASFSSLPIMFQKWFERFQGLWATLAGFSFTLYLFHRPMTQWLGANYPIPSGNVLQSTLVALAILFLCWVISFGTEKQLRVWRRGVARILGADRTQIA